MNKKAITKSNLVYLVLTLMFLGIVGGFIGLQMNGASLYGKYYAKEFSKTINLAEPEDEITLDIHRLTGVALKNGQTNLNDAVTFNNEESEVCVKLSIGRKTCYTYFNNVDIVDKNIKLGKPANLLRFKVVEKQKVLAEINTPEQNEALG